MAWWLAYEELYGNMDKEYPIMSKEYVDGHGDLHGEDVIVLGGTSSEDTISFTTGTDFFGGSDTLNLGPTRVPGGMGDDHITLGYDAYPTMDSIKWTSKPKPKPDLKGASTRKYKEDKGIADLKDYVASTYQGHYTNDNSDVQTLDLIHSVGDAESFCRSNAIKYLSRYDKKGQAKRDILKAMHYCLLLYYFSGNTNDEITTRGYETF